MISQDEAGAPGPPAQMTTPRPLTLIGVAWPENFMSANESHNDPHGIADWWVFQPESEKNSCWKEARFDMDISPAAFQLGIKTVPNKNRLVENVLHIYFGLCKYLRMFACLWLEKNWRMRWLSRWEQDMVKTTCEPTRNTHGH